MQDPAIQVRSLSKRYLRGLIGARALFRTAAGREAGGVDLWAIRDVSFDVERGDSVAVIGRNGAGKSTLFKLLARVTEPTSGSAEIHGRIAALLEVGTGFHPDMTGRENVYMNGSILGMSQRTIADRFDDIVDFADIGSALDTPVKRYSSGMYMRLAFSVAAHLDAPILIVDEVLAVGDVEFQARCLGKIGQLSRDGRTVLFVSHNLTAVQSLCTSAIWLDQGTVREIGPTSNVVASYLSNGGTALAEHTWSLGEAPGNESIRLLASRALPAGASPAIGTTSGCVLEFDVAFEAPNEPVNLRVEIIAHGGMTVLMSANRDDDGRRRSTTTRFRCSVPGGVLNTGTYYVTLLAIRARREVEHDFGRVLAFEVHDDGSLAEQWEGRWLGVTRPDLDWAATDVEPEDPA